MSKDHPPIYPTDALKLTGGKAKIFDVIARRFMATLCKNAILEVKTGTVLIAETPFTVEGLTVKEANWRRVYPTRLAEKKVPDLREGERLAVIRRTNKKDITKPPRRYTQGGLVVEMEKRGLGTKSTRHEIISKLLNRQYVRGKSLLPTPAAFAVVEALENNAPVVTKPDMTASLEHEMNQMAEGEKSFEEVLSDSREMLRQAFDLLEKNEKKIGESIRKAIEKQNHFGTCPKCGHELVLRKSARGKRFIGCSNYPKCTNSYPLPQSGGVAFEGEYCPKCKAPMVASIFRGKKKKRCADMKCG
jgi:DNA topoisomerase-1